MSSIIYQISMLLCVSLSYAGPSTDDLLKYNFQKKDVSKLCNVEQEMQAYKTALASQGSYPPVAQLKDWKDPMYVYPNMHPYHKYIVDTVKEFSDISTVCEVGAGCGKIIKYLYAENDQLDLTCIEQSDIHLQQISQNFTDKKDIILPDLQIKANILKGAVPFLSEIEDNSFDCVYTCTVMMHLPYITAVLSAKELARITSKYILHIENKNVGPEWYDQVIVLSSGMSDINYTAIDYKAVYESLNFKTIRYFEFSDPHSPATYIYYLGEKIKTD